MVNQQLGATKSWRTCLGSFSCRKCFRFRVDDEVMTTEDRMNAENNCILKDQISQLPDDILVNIISRLTAREAGRTSVLASRWKYLWTLTTALIFDVSKDMLNLEKRPGIGPKKYVSWVNKVLELHRGSIINEFRVCFALRCSLESDIIASSITNWIYTAIAKGVQELELNFIYSTSEKSIYSDALYTVPQECYNGLKTAHGLSSIKSLRSLCLDGVSVTGEILEFFIHICPLERLRVAGSRNLRSLKVVGSSVQLKYLEILSFDLIVDVEISAPTLLSFKYYGRNINLNVENVPRLVDFSIGCEIVFDGPNISFFPMNCLVFDPVELEPLNLSFLPQLETLAMGLHLDIGESIHFPQCDLPKLKHLTLDVNVLGTGSLLSLISVINACPYLQKFTLKLVHVGLTRRGEFYEFPKCHHQHLKVVELTGFVGDPIDIEFALYFLENANLLEKMIVEPMSECNEHNYRTYKDVVARMLDAPLSKFHYSFIAHLRGMIVNPSKYIDNSGQMAFEPMFEYGNGPRQRAEMLKTKVPEGVELIIR